MEYNLSYLIGIPTAHAAVALRAKKYSVARVISSTTLPLAGSHRFFEASRSYFAVGIIVCFVEWNKTGW